MTTPDLDEAFFRELFEWLPQPYIWLRPVWNEAGTEIADFVYVYSNAAGLEYLHLQRAQLGELRLSETPSLTEELRPKVFDELMRALQGNETVVIDMYNPVISRYARVFRLPFRGGVMTTIQDKTDERRAIQELKQRTEQLEQSNSDLEEFAYAASHDLQEPLRKITTFSDRLSNELTGQLSTMQESLLGRLQSSATRMKGLIDDLLAFSRVSTRKEPFQRVDLNSILQEALQDLEGAVHEAGAEVRVGKLPTLEGDPRQLQQLFQNLLSNAIKYRNTDRNPIVEVSGRLLHPGDALHPDDSPGAGAWYLVEVRDNGIGLDMQYAGKIFQVFQRLHGRAEYEGSGIGLSIVQKVAARHGGVVRVASEPGNGAAFRLLLPVELLHIEQPRPDLI
ncbi:MAG: hypothetical protein EOO15_05010 [Chitinophagaceae bacterium]|nr:MAG: hypothetical protein EOO15_05010 [Chitinophagaceae bacterium]